MAVESAIQGVAQIGTVVDNIVNSADKVKIAEYQASGEIAKANALIAQAQAKAEADAAAKTKTRNTYIVVGGFVILLIGGLILLLKKKPVVQTQPQYVLSKPIMPSPLLTTPRPT